MSAEGHMSDHLPKVTCRYVCLRSHVCHRTAVRRNISFRAVTTCGRAAAYAILAYIYGYVATFVLLPVVVGQGLSGKRVQRRRMSAVT